MTKRARLDSDYEDSDNDDSPTTKSKKNKKIAYKHLAVVDLDQTLIDKKYKLLDGACTFLSQLQNLGYYVILWTAGDQNHVKEFFKEYPICKPHINDIITGLVNSCKPVSVARMRCYKKLKSFLGANIFVDDNLGNIEKSDYDYKFCVLDYSDSKGNIDFIQLLNAIRKVP